MEHRYVFLVRHGSRVHDPLKSEREDDIKDKLISYAAGGGSDSTGTIVATSSAKPTYTTIIAGALANLLESMGDKQITRIVFSPHTAAEQTAEVFRQVLAMRGRLVPNYSFEADQQLDPSVIWNKQSQYTKVLDGSGWLIVGHQPTLTRLADWRWSSSFQLRHCRSPARKLHVYVLVAIQDCYGY